ncbi:MAG: alanine--glyoxylate aminotransferase family protein [Bdellovibrionales bacterium]|nr:alanine--glyoxylate aminotransferase family protein [Bdellovibrionales bacterium]
MNKQYNLKPLLLTPGPVPIPKLILDSLSRPMIHHRCSEFEDIFKQTKTLLKKIFQTKQEVFILNASGTGAMASSLLNTLSPKDTVLVLSAGKFGERWAEMALTYNLHLLKLDASWGQTVSIQNVKNLIDKNPQIKAILVQACETSTGVLHPIKELATLTRDNPNILLIVDAISALGAVDINMDQWGIDVMIGGSQKSFCLPAGMSFIALSQKAWQFNESSRLPVYYLDLKKEKVQAKGQTAFSSNVTFIQALHSFLLPLKEINGLDKMIQKSEALSQMTHRFCKSLNLNIFAAPPSPSVTSISLPPHIDGVKLKKYIEQRYQVALGGGQDKLKGRIIRVGHLGAISTDDLKRGLKSLALGLQFFDPRLVTKKDIELLKF